MSDRLTLADLVGGHVSVEWFEAVALVREVAAKLVDHPGPSVPIPDLNQIHLSPEGRVDISGGKGTDEPVRRLGQLLLALLANSEMPVQLRLVISQATAPVPAYKTTRDYSEALAFFERPDRSLVLQALAIRAATTAAPIEGERAPTLDGLAPLPKTQPERPKSEPEKRAASKVRRSQQWRFAASALIVLGVSGGVAWYAWRHGIGPQSRVEVSAITEKASDAVGIAVLTGASAVTERLGLGRIVPGDAAAPPAAPAPAPPTPPAKPAAQPKTPQAAAPAAPEIVAFDLDPAPPAPPTPEVTTRNVPPVPPDPTIYTVESQNVMPPVGIRPQLARQIPPEINREELGRLELVIGPTGAVESAKLLGLPRNVQDSLFVSVAKAWSFQPAYKDGHPVRYRKTVWIGSR